MLRINIGWLGCESVGERASVDLSVMAMVGLIDQSDLMDVSRFG